MIALFTILRFLKGMMGYNSFEKSYSICASYYLKSPRLLFRMLVQKTDILRRLNQNLGEEKLKEIIFR